MRRPSPPSIQSVHVPAPVGGLNTISPGGAMPLTDCVQMVNLVASEYGLRARLGHREWCTGLTGGTTDEVRSILPFTGSTASGSENRLFACTSTGIWDVTTLSSSPTQVFAFSISTGNAGYGVAHVMVTDAGHFLVYCDEENGMHVYSQATHTWVAVAMGAAAGEIDGVDPATFVFVTVFKGRLWFVARDSAELWYLDTGLLYGTATKFDLGMRLRAGGSLVGAWSWTIDGGSGLDDSLVVVSTGGDVCIYQGTDPSSASTFGLKGVWYVGGVPSGRHIASNYGGDLLLMSRLGILQLSRLLAGEKTLQYETSKISNLLNHLMLTRANLRGWSMRLHPEENALMVTVPTVEGQPTEQLAMSLGTRGWGPYKDLPIHSSEVFDGKLYFGTVDGRVCINDGYVDGVTLADPSSYAPVQWSVLTAFQNLGNARAKQIHLLRPKLVSESAAPQALAEARYNFDFTEATAVVAAGGGSNTWDTALWDVGVWGGAYSPTQAAMGAVGVGTDVAVAVRGAATSRTVLVGVDVLFQQGGLL